MLFRANAVAILLRSSGLSVYIEGKIKLHVAIIKHFISVKEVSHGSDRDFRKYHIVGSIGGVLI